jgi:hypothetical protein
MEAWHDFYLMLGPTAGALIGLLFVVITLTANMERKRASEGITVYLSPTVFHLGAVVFLSGIALAPNLPPRMLAGLVLACGLIGLAYAVYIGRGLVTADMETYTSDFWWYAVAVGVLYAELTVTGGLFFSGSQAAPMALAGGLLVLLLILVHNA